MTVVDAGSRVTARVLARAARPIDAAALAAFRIAFGLIALVGVVRLLTSGWIAPMYQDPEVAFTYPGFGWVTAWPSWGMELHYAVLGVLAALVTVGLWSRLASALFALGFAYTQLIDTTNYLNHHYLVVLLAGLLVVLPAHRTWSIDAWRAPSSRLDVVPAWTLWLLRFQVGVVYVFAGLAKLQSDWLLHAQPLNIWLSARTDTPLVGAWLDEQWVAYAMSWAGFAFDTTIVAWLLWGRSRVIAYVVLCGFHAATGYFFNIGMFPLIMTGAALVFFPPELPRRAIAALALRAGRASIPAPTSPRAPPTVGRALGALLVVHVVVQLALPLRHHLYPGDVRWNEDGARFAWQVMVREKHGSVTYIVRFPDGRRLQVPPRRYLTARQERELAGYPDLILALGRRIGAEMHAAGHADVRVTVDARVSLNGRPAEAMIDPEIDLLTVSDVGARTWVTPAPSTEPIHLRARP